MKEQDLIDLGFDRIDISAEESGDEAFYFYTYEFTRDFSLISCTNDEGNDTLWFVELDAHWNISFYNKNDVKAFIQIINRNKI